MDGHWIQQPTVLILVLGRLSQEARDFKASLCYHDFSLGYMVFAHSSSLRDLPKLGIPSNNPSGQRGMRKQVPGTTPQALFSKCLVIWKPG